MTATDPMLLARMAAHLRPGQVAQRARLRAQRSALRHWPGAGMRLCGGPDPAAAVGWPAGYRPLDARTAEHAPGLAELTEGKIRLLGITRELGATPDWSQAAAPQLWRFHLHYWDWSWALASDADRASARALFARLWRSWRAACAFGRGDAWLPYPAALRAWSWSGLYRDLVAGSEIETCFVRELALHTGFLRLHLESDVGGNHLVKDLKALAGLAVFFGDDRLLRQSLRRLTRQVAVQVLPDGGHYERAPAYHCQVLADLTDVANLIRAAGLAPPPEITAAIARMRRWLGVVLSPCLEVPMLNDGYPVGAALVAALQPAPPQEGPLLALPDTGLIRASVGGWHLLADVGAPCPDELPAHAHADTFGCLVHVDGAPLLVDTGTSTYAAGPLRSYERSTAAHNTVEVDGADSTEVWGAFRAASRARAHVLTARASADSVIVAAVHDGYRALPGRPRHQRRWSLTASGLRVDDLVTGHGRHKVVVRWHVVPGSSVRLGPGGATVTTLHGTFLVTVTTSGGATLSVGPKPVAAGLGRRAGAPVLACHIDGMLPVRVTTGWRRAPGAGADGGSGGAR